VPLIGEQATVVLVSAAARAANPALGALRQVLAEIGPSLDLTD
jgi:hypothetical protein